jgi:hypothetical protein
LPTAVAKVRVVVDGGSIDGATLVADASSGSSSSYARADVVDGLATLRNVPAGSYVLTLRAADESWSWRSPQPVELRASETVETELSLRLARRTVRVVGEDSKPIARREISASTGGGNSRPLGTTGDEGEIDLTLPEGRVLFACAGFALKPEQVDWSRGETPVVLVAAKER